MEPPAGARRVIFNADDFGASARANAAVIRACRYGVLTSASLMVAEPGFEQAVQLARECPALSVGLHLALTDGIGLLGHAGTPDLVDARGRFAPNPAIAGPRWWFRRPLRRQIAREARAQFERYAAADLPMAHVNGHQHAHLHPVVWRAMAALCEAHGVRCVRVPWEPLPKRGDAVAPGRMVEWVFLRAMSAWCRRDAARRGLLVADRVIGHLRTGDMAVDYVLRVLPRVQAGLTEVYFHPGTEHARAAAGGEAELDVDLEALTSARVRDQVAALCLVPSAYGSAGA